jgi:hypothetical protein
MNRLEDRSVAEQQPSYPRELARCNSFALLF